MIKAFLATVTTAFLAVGCVAFPEDSYSSRGGYYGNTGYGTRYDQNDRRYDDRYDRERAYRLQQARIEQDRRQNQLDHDRRKFEQKKRDEQRVTQAQRQQWEQRQREWQKKQQQKNTQNSRPNRPNNQVENTPSNNDQRNKKRDNRRGPFNQGYNK